jgi:hypothetical protein
MNSNIYLIKYGCECFPKNSLVKFEAITYSGDCYLVSDINDSNKRKWLMYYELYKLVEPNEPSSRWMYNKEYDIIMRELLNMN